MENMEQGSWDGTSVNFKTLGCLNTGKEFASDFSSRNPYKYFSGETLDGLGAQWDAWYSNLIGELLVNITQK